MKNGVRILTIGLGLAAFCSLSDARTMEAVSAPTAAQDSEQEAASSQSGAVNRIDGGAGTLEVDGAAYAYGSDMKVTGKDGKPAAIESIRQGARVEIRTRRERDGSQRVVELRVHEDPKADKEDEKDRKGDGESERSGEESR